MRAGGAKEPSSGLSATFSHPFGTGEGPLTSIPFSTRAPPRPLHPLLPLRSNGRRCPTGRMRASHTTIRPTPPHAITSLPPRITSPPPRGEGPGVGGSPSPLPANPPQTKTKRAARPPPLPLPKRGREIAPRKDFTSAPHRPNSPTARQFKHPPLHLAPARPGHPFPTAPKRTPGSSPGEVNGLKCQVHHHPPSCHSGESRNPALPQHAGRQRMNPCLNSDTGTAQSAARHRPRDRPADVPA